MCLICKIVHLVANVWTGGQLLAFANHIASKYMNKLEKNCGRTKSNIFQQLKDDIH
jgi:hypothetical protein